MRASVAYQNAAAVGTESAALSAHITGIDRDKCFRQLDAEETSAFPEPVLRTRSSSSPAFPLSYTARSAAPRWAARRRYKSGTVQNQIAPPDTYQIPKLIIKQWTGGVIARRQWGRLREPCSSPASTADAVAAPR